MDKLAANSSVKQYYVAVSTVDAKLTTLLELLTALQLECKLSIAICCGSRDALDLVVYSLMNSNMFSVYALHSDMTDKERELQIRNFKRIAGLQADASTAEATVSASLAVSPQVTKEQKDGKQGSMASYLQPADHHSPEVLPPVLVMTNVCLKCLPKDQLPLGVGLLIQYDLPYKKEVYTRRVAAAFGAVKERRGAQNVIVDLFTATEVPLFRSAERFTSATIQEMPVHVADVFVT